MMRSRAKATTLEALQESPESATSEGEWEVRPGGMLVQKRDAEANGSVRPLPPPIRVRVKYGSVHHEVQISPDATFGELKKLLSADTGLHPLDQKVMYKDKERDSNAFLDMAGVKDRSKMVLMEDPAAQARRVLEMMKNAKVEKARKLISQIGRDIDRLVRQVSSLEIIVSKGKKVADKDILSLTEQLMNLLVKLDGIIADGDVKLQKETQVRRVQKYVETLDILKVKNAPPRDLALVDVHQKQSESKQDPSVVVTTRWETFDLLSSMPPTSSTNTTISVPKSDWELF